MRMLTTNTRRRLESIIGKLSNGDGVTLNERIEIQKYSERIPFIAGKIRQALRKRELLENDGLT